MEVKLINKSGNKLPKYATIGSAGMDIASAENYVLKPERRTVIQTGLFPEIPAGYELQLRSRSGLAANNGVIVLNAPATIDSDYRGEIGVILYNSGQSNFEIKKGDRIAQMVLAKVEKIEWKEVSDAGETSQTERGDGGFGSTGQK